MNELLDKYFETFKEQFPLMLFMGVSEEEVVATIKECLKVGKPYEADLDNDIVY